MYSISIQLFLWYSCIVCEYFENKMKTILKMKEVLVLPDGRMDSKNAAQYTGLSEKDNGDDALCRKRP